MVRNPLSALHIFILYCTLFCILVPCLSFSDTNVATDNNPPSDSEMITSSTMSLISLPTLIRVTYDNNKEIEAVRYDLEVA